MGLLSKTWSFLKEQVSVALKKGRAPLEFPFVPQTFRTAQVDFHTPAALHPLAGKF